MLIEIQVENIKCGGCANSIRHGLLEDPRIKAVDVDIEHGLVKLDASDEEPRHDAVARLYKMGYPQTGSVEGIAAAAAKAKSFVSCAIGRMSGD
ncbi:MAG: heavy-metal-associated domain-containing protein [Thiotrichales bacterium]